MAYVLRGRKMCVYVHRIGNDIIMMNSVTCLRKIKFKKNSTLCLNVLWANNGHLNSPLIKGYFTA